MMEMLKDLADALLFPNRDEHAIPVLDGPYSPNQLLDQGRVLGDVITAPDDFALAPDGTLYISSGQIIIAASGVDFAVRRAFIRLEAPVGGLAWHPSGVLLACIAGSGIAVIDASGSERARITSAGGADIRCPTAITVAADGMFYVTDGSEHNTFDRWREDLMQARPPSGRLLAFQADWSSSAVLATGLAWPAGVTLAHGEHELWVSECWTHRLSAFTRDGKKQRVLVANFAGYPTRIAKSHDGHYWLAFFALRTQLVEFILRERAYCERMMAQVTPDLWICPSLASEGNYLEPTQMGGIKKLGIQKMWSPPRSYGLVARLDEDGAAVESLHSRVGGKAHGMSAVRPVGERILAASKGNHRIIELPLSRDAQRGAGQ